MANQADLDRTMVALADPTRRAILRRLAQGEARVTELARPFAMSLNSVSKHIRMLESARLVRRRRRGASTCCRSIPSHSMRPRPGSRPSARSGLHGSTRSSGR